MVGSHALMEIAAPVNILNSSSCQECTPFEMEERSDHGARWMDDSNFPLLTPQDQSTFA